MGEINDVQQGCTGEAIVVPGTLRLYRSWTTDTLYRLHGHYGTIWNPVMSAKCEYRGITQGIDGRMLHDDTVATPALGCRCGIYGYYVLSGANAPIPGTVRASGKMLLGEKGARVEHAEIESLYLEPKWCIAPQEVVCHVFQQTYNVPIYFDIDEWLSDFPPEDVSALIGEQ